MQSEFDIPSCTGTAQECQHLGVVDGVHVRTQYFQVHDLMRRCCCSFSCALGWDDKFESILLVRANAHCHAPACMKSILHNLDTGEILCQVNARYGQTQAAMDEQGYIVALPPCVWGAADVGLAQPPLLQLSTRLRSVHYHNASYHQVATMADWDLRGAWAREPPIECDVGIQEVSAANYIAASSSENPALSSISCGRRCTRWTIRNALSIFLRLMRVAVRSPLVFTISCLMMLP
eukprot:gnl/TRDRNA2_/TRDRNA2_172059_c0_seq1.p1 gnl/TRDRNA2_/TRDRNA2_172059_c0~~gnl/TRDRNA2_/TRDRNA2_172059_c0_seq1.p1  ORF type:complete len:235 (+),score=1.92 gnl/TRDRNA2_/TRDRNA2_172059_c0_seq1:3-707(+)